MEKMINNVKRKKRKTRRCLDEIRKRAHSIYKSEPKGNNKSNVKSSNINTSNLSKNCITIQRLTLFPKVIRSETVTRLPPLLENSRQRFGNLLHNTLTSDQNPDILKPNNINPIYLKKDLNCVVKSNNFEIDSEMKNEIYFSNESSTSSFLLFSPINEHDKSQNDQSSSLSNASSPSSHNDYSYLLYEEFMDEIPGYLKHFAPRIINEDVIADTRSYLRNLFVEKSSHSSAQEDGNVYLSDNSINSSPDEILQNPKDYLRHCLYEHNVIYGDDIKESDPFSHISNTPFSRQSKCSQKDPENVQTQSIIDITPEYNYYPHKLN